VHTGEQPSQTEELSHERQTHNRLGAWFLGRRGTLEQNYRQLSHKGYTKLRAVELPLTSLADDAQRTRKMVAQQSGPVLLVGHSYGGAVISEAGDMPNVCGLVYVATFAPDAGESPGGISQATPPVAIANLAPDSDGYLWIKDDKFHESFCQDLT
jgi:pimeloyl-ACP methyl ester carboxylesterase